MDTAAGPQVQNEEGARSGGRSGGCGRNGAGYQGGGSGGARAPAAKASKTRMETWFRSCPDSGLRTLSLTQGHRD